jgi:dipeptidyl aminopeptidase/acylaminoacyl peptidase
LTAPYGAWPSPITADLIVAGTVRLGEVALDGDEVYWTEGRPAEGGRTTLVHREADGRTREVTPAPADVRTRVHEYGGGAYAVAGGTVVFSEGADGRLHRVDPGGAPRPITPEAALRYADLAFDRGRDRLVCVREDHRAADREPVNALVAVDLAGDAAGGRIVVGGNDFYAAPRLSADGRRLAWLTWNHPNMPWDGCELWVGELGPDGTVGAAERVAGGTAESIWQPEWSPDGALCFVSDRTGWWNPYRWRDGRVDPLHDREAEFGLPHWLFGWSTYAPAGPDRLVCAYVEAGTWRLATLDAETGELSPIATPDTDLDEVRAAGGRAVFRGGAPAAPTAIVSLDLATGVREELRRASEIAIDPGFLSTPRPIAFPTGDGLTAHAFFYPPTNRDAAAPPGELPPLLVQSHGGPTSATSTALDLGLQYWTSRGFAVLDVDYGGSTGYGRVYRERLDGRWGIVDVDDCVNGARFLVGEGLVDPDRLAIRGRSASGFTTLAALAFRDLFRAGASHFGIGDLETMTRDTHKFESRYLDRLIGPYPERADLYRERSPIHHLDGLDAPLILFQGLEDKVVPPDQAETMYEAVRAKGVPVAYVPFAGEGHGFRRGETIKRALEGELAFYARVFGFALPEGIEPVPIANLDPPAASAAGGRGAPR